MEIEESADVVSGDSRREALLDPDEIGDIIIKLDAHGYPSRNFVRGIAERLWAQPDLGSRL